MLYIPVGRIVGHQNQNSALSYPISHLPGIFRLHVVRARILCRDVRGHNDVELRAFQIGCRWRAVKRVRGHSESAEDLPEKKKATVTDIIPLVMEVLLLSRRIGPLLAVKPCIDEYLLSRAGRVADCRPTDDPNQQQRKRPETSHLLPWGSRHTTLPAPRFIKWNNP